MRRLPDKSFGQIKVFKLVLVKWQQPVERKRKKSVMAVAKATGRATYVTEALLAMVEDERTGMKRVKTCHFAESEKDAISAATKIATHASVALTRTRTHLHSHTRAHGGTEVHGTR